MCMNCAPGDMQKSVDARGRVWRFEFHRYFGPLVLGKRGEPLSRQPGSRSPFWQAFEAWQKANPGH